MSDDASCPVARVGNATCLPAYARGASEFIWDVQHVLTVAQSPILQEVRIERMRAIPKFVVSTDSGAVESPPDDQHFEGTVRNADVAEGNYEPFIVSLHEAAVQHAPKMVERMLRTVSATCDLVGHSVSAQGKPLTPDLILDMLERVELSFQPDGSISPGFKFVANPSTQAQIEKLEFTPEHIRRHAEIVTKKREAWFARKRDRRIR
jgi:hypothetical protein